MAVTKLVLVRHGESQWNKENRFTGWYDVDLSEKGVSEAKAAGKLLKEEGYSFDFAYTSVLKRAIHTLWNVLDELDQAWLPVEKSWKLNERHYGALQGLNKAETAEKYGDEQVKQWRRGFAPFRSAHTPRFPFKPFRKNRRTPCAASSRSVRMFRRSACCSRGNCTFSRRAARTRCPDLL